MGSDNGGGLFVGLRSLFFSFLPGKTPFLHAASRLMMGNSIRMPISGRRRSRMAGETEMEGNGPSAAK